MKKYIELIRIKHWIKNFLIFIPVICAKKLGYDNLLSVFLGFLSFSFMSSFIYIVNDIRDIEKDKLHPRKKKRPLPSGSIKKNTAIIISVLMFILSLVANYFAINSLLGCSLYLIIIYMIINLFYSFGLKNIAILDIVLLASGFVLRVYYGASVVNVIVSNWLFLTIMSASLFLGLGKRKKELLNNNNTRGVLAKYNDNFLDKFQYLTLALTLVFYSLWSIEQANEYIVFTVPLLIIIFMKYSLIVETCDEGDPTTIIYQDKLLLFLCALYAIIMAFLMLVF